MQRHLTEEECAGVWDLGVDGASFVNVLSNARITQIAKSYGSTPLAALLLDFVFAGGLHPAGFKLFPTAQAPRAAMDGPALQDLPQWVQDCMDELKTSEERQANADRKVDIMEAVCVVSLGGAAKSHLLQFFHDAATSCGGPRPLYDDEGKAPFRREVGNFSALALLCQKHGKVVYVPDEWGLAIHPVRGAAPKGTSTAQMMSMQAAKFKELAKTSTGARQCIYTHTHTHTHAQTPADTGIHAHRRPGVLSHRPRPHT